LLLLLSGTSLTGSSSLVMRYERTRAVNILAQPPSIFAGTGIHNVLTCWGVRTSMWVGMHSSSEPTETVGSALFRTSHAHTHTHTHPAHPAHPVHPLHVSTQTLTGPTCRTLWTSAICGCTGLRRTFVWRCGARPCAPRL
jgi:hypothetical protein